jgi:hypothetical protein
MLLKSKQLKPIRNVGFQGMDYMRPADKLAQLKVRPRWFARLNHLFNNRVIKGDKQ